jgi:DNA-binding transcriptional MerR regulator
MRIGELSRRIDVSADLLRVWERRYGLLTPRRTSGGTRLYSTIDESRVNLMKRYLGQGIPASQAAELARSARLSITPGRRASVLDHEAELTARRLQSALERFDETGAEQALQELLTAYSAIAVLRDVALPYARQIGERWEAHHMSVAQEHFAANFLQSRMLALARGWDRGLGPTALLACAPGDYHTLALIAFGITLHKLGWKIVYLGAATPVEMADAAGREVDAEQVVISGEVSGCLDDEIGALTRLAAGRRLALAGGAVGLELARSCAAEWLADDPVTAAYGLAAAQTGPRLGTGRPERVREIAGADAVT